MCTCLASVAELRISCRSCSNLWHGMFKHHPAPVLRVQVLSLTTAAYDRGDEFTVCRKLPELREALPVGTDSRRCDVYRNSADGLWVLHPFEPGQALRLEPVALDRPAALPWAEVPAASN